MTSWIELNAAALQHNIGIFRRLLEGPRRVGLAAVLKANAYGHGLSELLPIVHGLLDRMDVIAPADALAIRAVEKSQRVLVLGATTPDEVVALARADVEVVLADEGWRGAAELLRHSGQRLRAQLHLDTGLGREGFLPASLPELCEGLRSYSDVIEVTGVLSHFANTEDVTEQEYARKQLDVFETSAAQVQARLGLDRIERHFAASAATLVLPEARFDMARVGVALYGLWPSAETRISARYVLDAVPPLEPVLSWKCRSQTVKRLPAGAFVGYGCTYRCPQETTIAVLPVGYFDGYPRLLSSRAHVLVNGTRCPVLGRVMMNHVVVDVSRAAPGDSVIATLLGRDGNDAVPAELLADWAQTINYEIVARLGAHLLRRVVASG